MWNKPDDCPTEEIHKLSESEAETLAHERIVSDLERAQRLLGNAETVFFKLNQRPVMNGRAFDLHCEYTSFAPVDQRWTCIDLNTYSGAPDDEAPSTFIGRGRTDYEARQNLLAQFAEYDADQRDNPKPRPSRKIYSSGAREEPDDYASRPESEPDHGDDAVTFDDDLEDRS